MDPEDYMSGVRKAYGFKGKLSDRFEEAELAFLATLDWFFKEVPKKDGVVNNVLSKKDLHILDFGCGSMPYVWPMKFFFENVGTKRSVSLCGLDDAINSADSARNIISDEN